MSGLTHTVLPFQGSIVDVLTFLQELLGLSLSVTKVYLAGVSTCHVCFDRVLTLI